MYKMLVKLYSIYFFLLKNRKTGLGLWTIACRITARDGRLPQSPGAGAGAQGPTAALAFPRFTGTAGAVSCFRKALALVATRL